MIHMCAVYVAIDFLLIVISFFAIRNVKKEAQKLIEDDKYKEYR